MWKHYSSHWPGCWWKYYSPCVCYVSEQPAWIRNKMLHDKEKSSTNSHTQTGCYQTLDDIECWLYILCRPFNNVVGNLLDYRTVQIWAAASDYGLSVDCCTKQDETALLQQNEPDIAFYADSTGSMAAEVVTWHTVRRSLCKPLFVRT